MDHFLYCLLYILPYYYYLCRFDTTGKDMILKVGDLVETCQDKGGMIFTNLILFIYENDISMNKYFEIYTLSMINTHITTSVHKFGYLAKHKMHGEWSIVSINGVPMDSFYEP